MKKLILKQDYLLKRPEFKDNFGKNTDGAIYAISPFYPDENQKLLIKIGMSINMLKRVDSYHTAYPERFSFIALLRPDYLIGRRLKFKNREYFLRHIERELMEILNNNPNVIKYKSIARVNYDKSEWFYCTSKDIHEAFKILDHKFVSEKNRSATFLFSLTYKDGQKYNKEEKKGDLIFEINKIIKII